MGNPKRNFNLVSYTQHLWVALEVGVVLSLVTAGYLPFITGNLYAELTDWLGIMDPWIRVTGFIFGLYILPTTLWWIARKGEDVAFCDVF